MYQVFVKLFILCRYCFELLVKKNALEKRSLLLAFWSEKETTVSHLRSIFKVEVIEAPESVLITSFYGFGIQRI